jgi:hypothetical protein
MAFYYSEAPEQRDFDVIPDGTVAVVQLSIRPGDAGENGMLTRSKDGQSEGLDCELTVTEGPYARRKFWIRLTLSGTTGGHGEAAKISRGLLRAILESARGVKPADVSEAAKKARVAEYADFHGIRFIAKIGVEPARDGYKAKNKITKVITPDMKDWRPIEQVQSTTTTAAAPAEAPTSNVIVKPAWAQ